MSLFTAALVSLAVLFGAPAAPSTQAEAPTSVAPCAGRCGRAETKGLSAAVSKGGDLGPPAALEDPGPAHRGFHTVGERAETEPETETEQRVLRAALILALSVDLAPCAARPPRAVVAHASCSRFRTAARSPRGPPAA